MFTGPFRQLLRRLLGRDVNTARSSAAQFHLEHGKTLGAAGQHANAASAFERALALEPAHAEAHYRLGLALRDQGRLAEAAASYQRALTLRPDYAEAHNNLGAALQLQGKLNDALASFRRAVDLDPDFSQPYLNLGRLLEALGDRPGAAQVYRRALERNVEAETFRHLINAAQGITTTRAPAKYARTVFDNFAEHFDARLVNDLGYRIPQILGASVTRHFTRHNLRTLDLGCGTGLCGLYLKERCARLTGIDLSPAMLAKARARGIYDELTERDVADYLRTAPSAGFDAIVAADVFIYIGELTQIFADVTRILADGGVFAFSVERTTGSSDFVLQSSGRYAQSIEYVARLALHYGLTEIETFAQTIRGEPGHAVDGQVFVFGKT